MPYITWQKIHSVNIKQFDDDHKKLIGLINELHDSMKIGQGRAVVEKILTSMFDYTQNHFTREETYMTQHRYPEFAKHRAAHREFTKKVADFRKSFIEGKLALSVEVMDFLRDWLVNHILDADKKYGPFLNEKGVK